MYDKRFINKIRTAVHFIENGLTHLARESITVACRDFGGGG
jgi:hypothetical protein